MARVWEPAQFQPFDDLTAEVRALGEGEPLVVVRRYEAGQRTARNIGGAW